MNWFVQISLAIKHVHDRKILHRDIKTQVCDCTICYIAVNFCPKWITHNVNQLFIYLFICIPVLCFYWVATIAKVVTRCTVIDHKMLQRVKNKTSTTRLRLMSYILFFTRCDVICDLLQYTRTGKCNLFVKLMLDYLYTVLMLANITKKVTRLQYTVWLTW